MKTPSLAEGTVQVIKMVLTRFMKRAEECGVCRGPISVKGELDSCLHPFCLDCILKWAEIENSCPICKRRFRLVTTKWARKCLREGRRRERHRYDIEEKDQASAAAMVYETGQYTIRVMFPPGGESQFAGLLRYLETLIRNSQAHLGQSDSI